MLVVIPRLYNSFFLTIQKRAPEKRVPEPLPVQFFFSVSSENCCAGTIEFKIRDLPVPKFLLMPMPIPIYFCLPMPMLNRCRFSKIGQCQCQCRLIATCNIPRILPMPMPILIDLCLPMPMPIPMTILMPIPMPIPVLKMADSCRCRLFGTSLFKMKHFKLS